jgi:hypothetical protein
MDDLEFFFSRIAMQPSGCWLWTGATGGTKRHVYGVYGGTSVHRWAYQQLRGPIPDGLVLDHEVCDTKLCANPWHCRPKTQRENLARAATTVNAINAAKTHCVNGHAFTPTNTYLTSGGQRACRACKRDWARQARARTNVEDP